MARVRSKDTKPERAVRSLAHGLGYRFRLHVRKLPGSPDIVFPGRRKVIFVNGCFWHGHKGCSAAKLPTTRAQYWKEKIGRNMQRDERVQSELRFLGWQSLVIWECQIKRAEIANRIIEFLTEIEASH